MKEETRKKLEKEGLFDIKHKKKIPFLPNKIGIITSPSGSVIKDMQRIIFERFSLPIELYPSTVQGEKAVRDIIKGIKYFNHQLSNSADVLIIARGGGSIEDLWCFNNEDLARSVFKSDIPIILNSATVEDQYEGDFATRRAIVWSLAFMMKGFIYPDIKDNSAVIKKVVTDLHLAGGDQPVGEPIRLLLEDSTLQTSNYVLLDNDPNETSSVVKFITEDSPEGASTGVVSRITNESSQNVDDPSEDFGFTTDIESYDFPREWNSGTNAWESL